MEPDSPTTLPNAGADASLAEQRRRLDDAKLICNYKVQPQPDCGNHSHRIESPRLAHSIGRGYLSVRHARGTAEVYDSELITQLS